MSEHQNVKDQLRQRAVRAMLADGILRWESAVTIALTMLLVFFVPTIAAFPWWQWWFWVILGGLAEVAQICADKASYAYHRLTAINGVRPHFEAKWFFNELSSNCPAMLLRWWENSLKKGLPPVFHSADTIRVWKTLCLSPLPKNEQKSKSECSPRHWRPFYETYL